EKLGIQAARKNLQFPGVEATLDPPLPILFRVNENGIELPIEPMHIAPRGAFQKAILSKNPDVLREISMINAARLEIEHFGCKQRGKSHRAGSADNDLGKSLPLDVIEHLKDWGKTQFLQFIFGKLEFTNGRKIFNWDITGLVVAAGSYHR